MTASSSRPVNAALEKARIAVLESTEFVGCNYLDICHIFDTYVEFIGEYPTPEELAVSIYGQFNNKENFGWAHACEFGAGDIPSSMLKYVDFNRYADDLLEKDYVMGYDGWVLKRPT